MKLIHKIIILSGLFCATASAMLSQNNQTFSPTIKTLQTIVNDDWLLPTVITLNSDDWVTVSFDQLSHDYHRYLYYIVHCNADWQPSALFEVDYMDGFNGRTIEDYENSLNTSMLYTHYRFTLPNEHIQLKVSGNYMVKIFDDEQKSDQPVAVACFRVVDPKVDLTATVSSNTDIDTNNSHQQVSFILNYNQYEIIQPSTEIKPYIYQNNRTDNCIRNIKPTYLSPGRLEYSHNKQLIFPAGNEYRRFEIINMHYATQGVDEIQYFAPYFHAVLFTDAPRRNYSYDQDHDGRYLIRYNLSENNDTEADYLFAHFTLQMPAPLSRGSLYLSGELTGNRFAPDYQMTYNEEEKMYESTLLLKQGAYDYMYLWVPETSSKGQTGPVEGNFYEAENEYQIYIYHRPFGERYDKLIAVEQLKFSQE